MTWVDPDVDGEEDEDDEEPGGLDTCEVTVTPPQLLGTLLGPDGEVIRALYDRRIVPFGFQVPASPPR